METQILRPKKEVYIFYHVYALYNSFFFVPLLFHTIENFSLWMYFALSSILSFLGRQNNVFLVIDLKLTFVKLLSEVKTRYQSDGNKKTE